MRYSELFIPTLKETPSEAVLTSHRLMLRAGMIRQLTSGVYCHLLLGVRSFQKVAAIIREEMNRAGAQEVFLPVLQPAELWQESGRWLEYGQELFRLKDRHGRPCCLGPTHEEVITYLVRNEIRSYRQLPVNLYQIQTKFRDEIRPRFGVMRAREFSMKDAYSFDVDEEGAEISYRKMHEAYNRIFERCGLTFKVVEAESGPIGGSYSHEFMVLAESGEDAIVSCNRCDYGANVEKGEIRPPDDDAAPAAGNTPKPLERVSTPGKKTVEEVTAFLGVKPERLVKTMIYLSDGRPVAVLVRGDHEVNETKVARFLGCGELSLADESTIQKITGAPKGYAGPVGLGSPPGESGVRILADYALQGMSNFVTGGNEEDVHLVNVNVPRDFSIDHYGDFRMVQEGDPCPRCGGKLQGYRGIEVGHIFKLGTKYSEALGATFLDEKGRARPMIMGCYGIGIERTVAAAIEQHHDEKGIIFPMPIAPFQVIILCLNPEIAEVRDKAEVLYRKLKAEAVEVLLDDRAERPGRKFNDADLIGIPLRINVGARGLGKAVMEIHVRETGKTEQVPMDRVSDRVMEILNDTAERYPRRGTGV